MNEVTERDSDSGGGNPRSSAARRIDDAAWEIIADELDPPKNAPPTRVRASRRQREFGIGEEITSQAQEAQPAADPRRSANRNDPLPGVV